MTDRPQTMKLPDLRFVEYPYEALVIREYLGMLDTSLAEVLGAGRQRLEAVRDNSADEAESDVARHMIYLLEDGVITRFLPASGVIAVWSLFEAAVTRFAEEVQTCRQSLSLNDLRGDFLQRAELYFRDIAHVALCESKDTRQALQVIAVVRNIVAHSNGRLADVRKSTLQRLDQIVRSDSGLQIVVGYLIIDISWVRWAESVVSTVIHSLKDRVEEAFPVTP